MSQKRPHPPILLQVLPAMVSNLSRGVKERMMHLGWKVSISQVSFNNQKLFDPLAMLLRISHSESCPEHNDGLQSAAPLDGNSWRKPPQLMRNAACPGGHCFPKALDRRGNDEE